MLECRGPFSDTGDGATGRDGHCDNDRLSDARATSRWEIRSPAPAPSCPVCRIRRGGAAPLPGPRRSGAKRGGPRSVERHRFRL